MADCKNLELAREWAADIDADRQTLSQDTIDAAVEVIRDLPDEWVDADRLRKYISDWREGLATAPRGNYEGEMLDDLEDMLPAPPAPRTMDKIEWDDEKHYLAEAVAEWFEGEPTKVVMLSKVDGKIMVHQDDKYSSGLRYLNPGILTPTGRRLRLIPDEGVPEGDPIEIAGDDHASHCASCAEMEDGETEFDPAYTYRDRDGETSGPTMPQIACGYVGTLGVGQSGPILSRPPSTAPTPESPRRTRNE